MARQQEEGGGRRAVREARLADKLRQNLVRRKAKARAQRDAAASSPVAVGSEPRTRRASRGDNDERES